MKAARKSRNAIRNAATVRSLRLCVPCARLQHRERRCRECGGETEGCASKGEARRLRDLALSQRAGVICDLKLHPRFELHIAGNHVGTMVADAGYRDDCGRPVVEDVKGEGVPDDELSKLKRALVKALYGIEVRLVTPGGLPWHPRKPPRRKKVAT